MQYYDKIYRITSFSIGNLLELQDSGSYGLEHDIRASIDWIKKLGPPLINKKKNKWVFQKRKKNDPTI